MPLNNLVKLNSEAAVVLSQKEDGLGFVVRDSVRKMLLASVAFKPSCADVLAAEAWALAGGLARVVNEGFSKVKVDRM